MSSTLRYFNQIKPLTKLESLSTPSYTDSIPPLGQVVLPIPFTYHNGVLDINTEGSNVQAALIDITVFNTNLPIQGGKGAFKAKEMGGTGKVFSLGPKMIEWLTNIVNANVYPPYNGGGSFVSAEVQEGGYVTKAQLTIDGTSVNGVFAANNSSYAISTDKPTGDQYVYGTVANNYYTTWIFKNPVVIKIRQSVSPNVTYFSLYSNWTLA
jgi:hypothetical protein